MQSKNRDFYLLEDGGVIYAWKKGRSVPLLRLKPDETKSAVWAKGVEKLLDTVDLVSDETLGLIEKSKR